MKIAVMVRKLHLGHILRRSPRRRRNSTTAKLIEPFNTARFFISLGHNPAHTVARIDRITKKAKAIGIAVK